MGDSLPNMDDSLKEVGQNFGVKRRTPRVLVRDQQNNSGNIGGAKSNEREGTTMTGLLGMLKVLREEMSETKEEVRKDIRTLQENIKELQEENGWLKTVMGDLTEKHKFEKDVLHKLRDLEEKIDEAKQYNRNNNLVIDGIPKTRKENTKNLVLAMGKLLQISIKAEDVALSHRLPDRTQERPGKIIVRFVRRETRDEFLAKGRNKPLLTAKDLGLNSDCKIYVREDLIKKRAELFLKAREFKQSARNPEGKFKFVWTMNGEIFMKTKKGDKVIKISHEEDLPRP